MLTFNVRINKESVSITIEKLEDKRYKAEAPQFNLESVGSSFIEVFQLIQDRIKEYFKAQPKANKRWA